MPEEIGSPESAGLPLVLCAASVVLRS